MWADRYHFVNDWMVPAPPERVWPLVSDVRTYPAWWPEVYRDVAPAGGPGGALPGSRARLHTKGCLPYHLYWTAEVDEVDPPRRLAARASGDFAGRAVWTLAESPAGTLLRLDWELRAAKPLLRLLSPLLRPLFAWNHRWAMRRGEQGLRAYLQDQAP